MSDDDFMQDSEEEQYDFEYEDDDDDESGDVGIENKYYNAKQMKVSEPEEAITEFLAIPAMEQEKGDWGFKGLKQAIKLEFRLGRHEDAVSHYGELLSYVKSAVSRNYGESSVTKMLDYVEKEAETETAQRYLERFYALTLDAYQTTNERLWLKTNIKLARLLLCRKEYQALLRKLRELHRACQRPDGTEDPAKGTYSLEIYALEIQMQSDLRNNAQLKILYQRALKVNSAVSHPKITAIIRECGGKMHMSEENWFAAYEDFFQSFLRYDEAGSLHRIQVLKYLLLTTMLRKSDISPFDSPEVKPYRNDHRVTAMTELVDAYQRDDVHTYTRALQRVVQEGALSDPIIAENMDEVTRNMRTKAVIKLIAPYTRVKPSWIANALKVSEEDVLDILGFLIVDGKVRGRIDQQAGVLVIESRSDEDRVRAVDDLVTSIQDTYDAVFHGDGFRFSESLAAAAAGDEGLPGSSEDTYVSGNPRGISNRGRGFLAKLRRGRSGGFDSGMLA